MYPLSEVEPELGGMMHASGTHKLGFLGQNRISDASQKIYGDMIAREGIPVVSSAPMRAGDVSFHYGWTLHAANANTSDTMREAMVVTYYADGMRVAEPANVYQEFDRGKFLGGRAVGEVADHPFNTLVHGA